MNIIVDDKSGIVAIENYNPILPYAMVSKLVFGRFE